MEITIIQARDLPEAWYQCLRRLLQCGRIYTIDRGSFAGSRRLEFDFVVVNISDPGCRPIVPACLPTSVVCPTSMEYVESYLPYLMTSEVQPNEQYTYGQYLEPQIAKVIQMYKKDGFETNQAYMAIGDKNSIDQADPPCLRGVDTRIRGGRLHFVVYFRSWDLWAGFPSNLAAIQLLKEYMASEIGVADGSLVACSKGLHLYEYSWGMAKNYAG